MIYKVTILAVMAASGQGMSFDRKECPTFCTFEYAPVCGTDGKTYSNECGLRVENGCSGEVTKDHDGECEGGDEPCPSFCTFEYKPVCGSDGKTYSNECGLRVENNCNGQVTKAHDGECGGGEDSCPDFCTFEYKPVCGTDGKTYSNECGLRVENNCNGLVTVDYPGECGVGIVKEKPLQFSAIFHDGNPDEIINEPGLLEKRKCKNDMGCRSGEFCHQLISGSGVCAPDNKSCSGDSDCGNIGNKFEGQVGGSCGDNGKCHWSLAEIII